MFSETQTDRDGLDPGCSVSLPENVIRDLASLKLIRISRSMAETEISIMQINFHHINDASKILAKRTAVV